MYLDLTAIGAVLTETGPIESQTYGSVTGDQLGQILLVDAYADFGQEDATVRQAANQQLVDDLLDYEGDALSMGKTVGDDLREGKPTLPLLLAMARCSDEDRQLMRHAIEHGNTSRLDDILTIVRRTGALQATREAARAEADKACAALASLPDTSARKALLELSSRSVERNF